MVQHEDTRLRPSRRTVARAAAWTVPVVAVATAAPAYAASPCDRRANEVLDWDGSRTVYTRSNSRTAKASFDPDGTGPVPVLDLNITAAYWGNMKSGYEFPNNRANPSLRVSAPVGGLGVSGLSMWQSTTSGSPAGSADRGAYTFSFTRPVSNLRFTLTDIDSQSGDFWDVIMLTPGYTVTSQPATIRDDYNGIDGQRRFFASAQSAPVDNATGGGGNLGLRYDGPISEFTITYYNGATSFSDQVDQDQTIYITDLTFDYTPC